MSYNSNTYSNTNSNTNPNSGTNTNSSQKRLESLSGLIFSRPNKLFKKKN